MLTLAISKGRIFQDSQYFLEKIGCVPDAQMLKTRSLIIKTSNENVRIIVVRAQDTPTFVACGAADAGIVGSDVLLEKPSNSIYEPIDLKIAKCRMVVAAPPETDVLKPTKKMTIATKYPNTARRFFNSKGISTHFIKLNGTMEVAPFVNLSDAIVDLADTGNTLKAHGLEEKMVIDYVSARFITNKVSDRQSEILAQLQQKIIECMTHDV